MEDEPETVEAVFTRRVWDAEATAEELLVDDGWKPVEVKSEGNRGQRQRTLRRHRRRTDESSLS